MADTVLLDATERVLRKISGPEVTRRASSGEWLASEWQAIEELGLLISLVDQAHDGLDINPREIADVLRLLGYWTLPLPVGEHVISVAALSRSGLSIPSGVVSLASNTPSLTLLKQGNSWSITGSAVRVPWARHADTLVVQAACEGRRYILALPMRDCEVVQGENLAGEPRDDVNIDTDLEFASGAECSAGHLDIHKMGAALRTVMIAGAAERILEMSLAFAGEHKQFGRPIAAFQAVQQNLAVMGEQAAVCRGAADVAGGALMARGGELALAASKAQAAEAGAKLCHLAHQIHGAMGFSEEYDLQLYTKRIWAWREEFGNETFWNEHVGAAAIAHETGLWSLISSQLKSPAFDHTGQTAVPA